MSAKHEICREVRHSMNELIAQDEQLKNNDSNRQMFLPAVHLFALTMASRVKCYVRKKYRSSFNPSLCRVPASEMAL